MATKAGGCKLCKDNQEEGFKFCINCGNQVNQENMPSTYSVYCVDCSPKRGTDRVSLLDTTAYCPICGKAATKLAQPASGPLMEL